MAPSVLWFRRDLRLADHPALWAAAEAGGAEGVVGLFVVDPALCRPSGTARAVFLRDSLESLSLATGGRLVLRRGGPVEVVADLAAQVGADRVFVTMDTAPYGRRRDAEVAEALSRAGRRLVGVGTPYAVDPGRVRRSNGAPYQVFTPFRRAWEQVGWPPPLGTPSVRWRTADSDTDLATLVTLAATALPRWWGGLPAGAPSLPPAGEEAAGARLEEFTADRLDDYGEDRDRPDREGTSRLSADLRFGALHPRQVLHALARSGGAGARGAAVFTSELSWREFYADVLFHHPRSATQPLAGHGGRLEVDTGPEAREKFFRWARGETGYPFVDAAMRQLLAEGWVHNRARMVAASFLVKDLYLPWQWGARWFMHRLVDGDLASNQHGWQWVAGTGTDAAPFHRIMSPTTQAARFDPEGLYVARYVPELATHAGPPPPRLSEDPGSAGIGPASPRTPSGPPARGVYPDPMVDHALERREAMARMQAARRRSS